MGHILPTEADEKSVAFSKNDNVTQIVFSPDADHVLVYDNAHPVEKEIRACLVKTAGVKSVTEGDARVEVSPGYRAATTAKNIVDELALDGWISAEEAREAYASLGLDPARCITKRPEQGPSR